MHTVSAWATGQRIVLGQRSCEGKSNEITAVPLLLKSLDLTGAMVTIDAMGTQTKIAQAILDGGGNYVLSLKENWPATFAKVKTALQQPAAGTVFETRQTVDGCNGRIETRRHAICHDVDWLCSKRRHPGEPTFPGLAPSAWSRVETERGGTINAGEGLLSLLRQTRCRNLRQGRARPLGDREPAALDARCRLPR